ncbi:hypothetical protein C7475_104362 [Chitinophaga sp. S165]|nr:hypothetical protein C7475_104362 [Chitinophaga sp. S165]
MIIVSLVNRHSFPLCHLNGIKKRLVITENLSIYAITGIGMLL